MTVELDFERFAGVARLYGIAGLSHLQNWHVAVIGVGGVGSWAAEALVRSGVGHLRLIDADDVCISNTNRQLHALSPQYGRPKVKVLSERLLQINPRLQIEAVAEFYRRETPELLQNIEGVIDAIDSVSAKAALLAHCYHQSLAVVVAGAAGGRCDPLQLQKADLSQAGRDPLLKSVRQQLYQTFDLPRNTLLNLPVIFSKEASRYPDGQGGICQTPSAVGLNLDCGGGLGASMMVTASMGLALAAQLIQRRLVESSS